MIEPDRRTWLWFALFATLPWPWADILARIYLQPIWIPWFAFGIIAILGIVAKWMRLLLLRFVLAAHAAWVLFLVGGLMRWPSVPRVAGIAMLAILLVAFARTMRRPSPVVVLLVANAFSAFGGYSEVSWKRLNDPWMRDRVLSSPAVTDLGLFGEETTREVLDHGDLRFALPRSDSDPRLLIGLRNGARERGGAFWFDPRDGSWEGLPVQGAGDHALMIPSRDLWIVPDYVGNAIVVGPLSGSGAMRYELAGQVDRPRVVAWDDARSRVLSIDEANAIWSIGIPSGETQFLMSIPDYVDWISWDSVRDQLVVTWSDETWLIDAGTLAVRARVPVTPCQNGADALDVAGRRLFRTAVEAGVLEVIDIDRAVVTRRLSIGFGAYYLAYDRPSDMLVVSNYARGWIGFYRAADLAEIGRSYIGRRSRAIGIRDDGAVTLTSSAGAFRIAIPQSST